MNANQNTFAFFLADNTPTEAEGNKITELRVHGGNKVVVVSANNAGVWNAWGTDYVAAMKRDSVPNSARHLLCLLYDAA